MPDTPLSALWTRWIRPPGAYPSRRHRVTIEYTSPPALTTGRKITFILVCWLVAAVLITASGEVGARLRGHKGYQPWRAEAADVRVMPGERFFVPDPVLGYKQLPGQFVVTLKNVFNFRVTHLPNGLRITHPLETYNNPSNKEEIWIFGCSFTHGWALNDEESYPWLLQAQLPEYEVVNFGVEGYGTIHSLLQYRDAIKEKRPKVAVLAYLSFHDERNTNLRMWRKNVEAWDDRLGKRRQPYARLDRDGNLRYSSELSAYHEFPFMRYSAFSHWLELHYNSFEERYANSRAVSQALIRQMDAEAKENGVKFLVAGLGYDNSTRRMLSYLQGHGTRAVDISVDPLIKGNSLAYDPHPGPLADKSYAVKLEDILRAEYLK